MKADYVHKDTLTATDYVELNKNNELLMSYNQALLKENQKYKEVIDNLKAYLKLNIELIKEQPSNDKLTDNFILVRFKSLLDYLKEVE